MSLLNWNKKFIIIIGLFLISLLFLTGCDKKIEEPKIQLKKIGQNKIRSPRLLDGVFVDEDKAELLPVTIIIDNFPQSRPPANLNFASVVYEAPVEANITRFLAIFDPNNLPEKIGPIRSARPYFVEIAEEYKGLFLHAGGSPQALEKLKNNTQIYNIEAIGIDERYFWRDPWRKAPFNLYISAKAIENIFKNKKIANQANFEPWQFELIENSKVDQEEIKINYKEPIIWRYDKENNIYLRFIGSNPHLDENGQQISTKNLILQITDIKIIDELGRREITLNGSGPATIFRNGQKIKGIWRRENNRTKFYDLLNQEIKFARGNTWVEIISESQTEQ